MFDLIGIINDVASKAKSGGTAGTLKIDFVSKPETVFELVKLQGKGKVVVTIEPAQEEMEFEEPIKNEDQTDLFEEQPEAFFDHEFVKENIDAMFMTMNPALMETGEINIPFDYNEQIYVVVSDQTNDEKTRVLTVYKVVDVESFEGDVVEVGNLDPESINETQSEFGFYHGLMVKYAGKYFVLVGPEIELVHPDYDKVPGTYEEVHSSEEEPTADEPVEAETTTDNVLDFPEPVETVPSTPESEPVYDDDGNKLF